MKKSKKADIAHSKDISRGKQLLLSSAFGALVGAAALLVFLFIMSAICLLIDTPHTLVTPMCFVAIYLASFIAGFFAVKRNKNSDALICGSLCGTILALALWVIFGIAGKILGGNDHSVLSLVWKLIIVLSSILGAFIGLKSRKRKRKF